MNNKPAAQLTRTATPKLAEYSRTGYYFVGAELRRAQMAQEEDDG
jgi:hypothetical protein